MKLTPNITFTEGETINSTEDNPQGDDNKQDTEVNSPKPEIIPTLSCGYFY